MNSELESKLDKLVEKTTDVGNGINEVVYYADRKSNSHHLFDIGSTLESYKDDLNELIKDFGKLMNELEDEELEGEDEDLNREELNEEYEHYKTVAKVSEE